MKKLKNDSGSALILALFLMILVSIIIVSFSNQVANQIRSTINLDKDMEKMYNTESKIEECIAEFIESIDIKLENENSYKIHYNKQSNKQVTNKKGETINTVNMTLYPPESEEQIPSHTTDITFLLHITEGSTNLESFIKVQISDIKNDEGNITYKIDYGVESWRIRN